MPDQGDVRRLALSLPETREVEDHFGFSVANKGKWKQFAWAWRERVTPKKPRIPRADVLAVRVADLSDKDALLASDTETFFTEPHYNGYPAVLVRLPVIGLAELEDLILDAWRSQAPRALADAFLRERAGIKPVAPTPDWGRPSPNPLLRERAETALLREAEANRLGS